MIRLALALALLGGCISQAKQVIAPEPEGGGTLMCREIVEQCDATCTDPLCLHQCTSQGTEEAQGYHAALLDCGQRSSCTDQACMEASCPTEISTCMAHAPAEQVPVEAPVEPDAPADPAGPPGETPPS